MQPEIIIFTGIAIILIIFLIRKNKPEKYTNMYGNWNVELIQTSPDYQVMKGAAMVTGGTITIHLESVPGDQIIQYNINVPDKKIISMTNKMYPIQEMSDNKIIFVDSENNTTITLTR